MSYNGWTNWDTWAVNLWSDNDEQLYRQKSALLKRGLYYRSKGKYDEQRLKKGLITYFKRVATFARKNGDEVNNKNVNWNELAKEAIDTMNDYA